MGLQDSNLILDSDSTLTSDGPSAKAQDTASVTGMLGVGTPLGIAVTVLSAPAAGGTYTVGLRTGATYSSNAIQSPTTLLTRTIPATATAGEVFWIDIPNESTGLLQEYIDLYFTLGGSNPRLEVKSEIKPRNFQDNWEAAKNGYSVLS